MPSHLFRHDRIEKVIENLEFQMFYVYFLILFLDSEINFRKNFGTITKVFLQHQLWIINYYVKKFIINLSNQNKRVWFCCLQDKMWIRIQKWTIFVMSSHVFVLITEIFWFFDFLTKQLTIHNWQCRKTTV